MSPGKASVVVTVAWSFISLCYTEDGSPKEASPLGVEMCPINPPPNYDKMVVAPRELGVVAPAVFVLGVKVFCASPYWQSAVLSSL